MDKNGLIVAAFLGVPGLIFLLLSSFIKRKVDEGWGVNTTSDLMFLGIFGSLRPSFLVKPKKATERDRDGLKNRYYFISIMAYALLIFSLVVIVSEVQDVIRSYLV